MKDQHIFLKKLNIENFLTFEKQFLPVVIVCFSAKYSQKKIVSHTRFLIPQTVPLPDFHSNYWQYDK